MTKPMDREPPHRRYGFAAGPGSVMDLGHGSELDPRDGPGEFGLAVHRYKQRHQRPFPTFTEVYEVFLSLGYRKVAPRGPLP